MTTMGKAARLLHVLAAASALLLSTQTRAQDYFLEELQQWQTPADRNEWYLGTQGSRLIPWDWLRSLEQPEHTALFLEPSFIEAFGYLSRGPSTLPVGFVHDTGPDEKNPALKAEVNRFKELQRTNLQWKKNQGINEPWVGMNCSACHTAQLSFQGRTFRVDGGPAMANFQGFMKNLNRALQQTSADPAKWSRFARRVLGGAPEGDADPDGLLKKEFDTLLAWQLAEENINKTTSEYGPGRVDAFGRIYNKVALLLGGPKAQGNPPDAPVSIPFIWHAPRRSAVQYNGIAAKLMAAGIDVGAVGRNTGEVIGVFGDVLPHKDPAALNGFASSVNVKGLIGLENSLARMMPPRWPAKLFNAPGVAPKIDGNERQARIDKGRALYVDNCQRCHELTDPDPKKLITVKLNLFNPASTPPKQTPDDLRTLPWADKDGSFPRLTTDPWMACNAYSYNAFSGPLNGFTGSLLTDGKTMPADAPLGSLLKITVAATLFDHKRDLAESAIQQAFGSPLRPVIQGPPVVARAPSEVISEKERRLMNCLQADPYGQKGSPPLGYTSRPLNGVWASPPFLHNGSVPTMYDLLLPQDKRPTSFFLGTRKYDPEKMGFETAKSSENWFEFRTIDGDGRPIYGNSNAGHDYGNAKFSDDDRYAIIEYLKTL